MYKCRYSFKRVEGIDSFLRSNRASTDALNALEDWLNAPNRFYEVQKDEDEELIAELQFEEDDQGAGPELDSACAKLGIQRTFIAKV